MNIKTALAETVARRSESIALRFKSQGAWLTRTYRELQDRAAQVAELLHAHGVRPGDRVALFRENSPEWPEIYYGMVAFGAVAVPIDAKLKEQEVAHILADSGARALFAGVASYPLLSYIEDPLKKLEYIFLIGGQAPAPVAGRRRIQYFDYESSLAAQAAAINRPGRAYDRHTPADHDIASLIYTSGTTGRQKGAMISHGNFIANVDSALKAMPILTAEDRFLLILPLHHSFAFTSTLLVPMRVGAEIALVESLKTIGENMAEVQPSVMMVVPLLLEKMYYKIMAGLKKKPLAFALVKCGGARVVGRGLLKKLGGRLRLMVSGGAPCDPAIIHGWEKFGIPVREGYGLTEASPVVCLNPMELNKPGAVGKALPDVELKIANPNELGVGELLVRGPNVMLGYYNNPDATAEVIRDGWLHTGDLAAIDADGFVTISGRCKSLIVNREGKNIYPEEVEYQLSKSPFILESLVLGYRAPGERVGERVGVIVVPNQEAIDQHARQHHLKLADRDIEDLVRKEVKRQCKQLSDYKWPRRIQVRFEEFEKTSTAKIKRYLYAIDTTRPEEPG